MCNGLTGTIDTDEHSTFFELKNDVDPFVEIDPGSFAGEALSGVEGKGITVFSESEEIDVVADVELGAIEAELFAFILEAHVKHEFLRKLIEANHRRHPKVMIPLESGYRFLDTVEVRLPHQHTVGDFPGLGAWRPKLLVEFAVKVIAVEERAFGKELGFEDGFFRSEACGNGSTQDKNENEGLHVYYW